MGGGGGTAAGRPCVGVAMATRGSSLLARSSPGKADTSDAVNRKVVIAVEPAAGHSVQLSKQLARRLAKSGAYEMATGSCRNKPIRGSSSLPWLIPLTVAGLRSFLTNPIRRFLMVADGRADCLQLRIRHPLFLPFRLGKATFQPLACSIN